jgi:Zn-dependent peptidase ImmA (M78 family)
MRKISRARLGTIEEEAESLRAKAHRKARRLWTADSFDQIDPKEIAKALGVRYLEPQEIFELGSNGERIRAAGMIDRDQELVQVAHRFQEERFSPEYRLFTACHEFGHWTLHKGSRYFRDAPIDGGKRDSLNRPVEEREADHFAAVLLMPEGLVKACFRQHFGVESLAGVPLDEHLASILSFGGLNEVKVSDLKNTREISRRAAECLSLTSQGSLSLASRFKVSVPAMAIRLEELGLVPVVPKPGSVESEPYDVFLSYARVDEQFLQRIVSKLREQGLNPWFDRLLVPGLSWGQGIERAIESSQSGAIFLGKQGLQRFQDFEVDVLINAFVERNRPIIPCLIPGWRGELPFRLKTFQWVDFRRDEKGALDQLVQGILTGSRKV